MQNRIIAAKVNLMSLRNGIDSKYFTLENFEGVSLETLAEEAFLEIKVELLRLERI